MLFCRVAEEVCVASYKSIMNGRRLLFAKLSRVEVVQDLFEEWQMI